MRVNGYEIRRKADLHGADLHGADLCGADLREANLSGADLHGADLRKANLRGANLYGADLREADLFEADLHGADLHGADLREANLSGADLSGADLFEAYLRGAYLCGANLRRADLRGAYLREADLSEVNLSGADLRGTCLDPEAPVPPLFDKDLLSAGFEIRGAEVWGWRTARSQYYGKTKYVPGNEYVAPVFSVAIETECHPGIYLAGKEWLENRYPGKRLMRCRCLRSELVHAGDKWRAKRIWTVKGEKGKRN